MKNRTPSLYFVGCVLAACLLIANAASAAVIFSDAFDDQTAGDSPSGWGVSQPATTTVQISDAIANSSPNSLRFDKPATGSFPAASRNFTAQETGIVTIELDGQTSTTNHDSLYIKIRNSSGLDIGGIRFDNQAVFAHMAADGTWIRGAVPYSASTWYRVRIELNLDNQTYSVWAGEETIVTDAPFRTIEGSYDAAALVIQDRVYVGAGTSYIDNLTVSGTSVPDPHADAGELQLFWTELFLGEIQTGRADGSGRATIVTGLNRPVGVHVDQENGYLYWAEDGVAGNSPADGRIGRSDLNGENVTFLYTATGGDAGLDNPQSVAVDAVAGMIYWTDHFSGVYRAPLDGSGPVAEVSIDTDERYTNLALDLASGHLYFGNPATGDLWRTDLDGDNFTPLATGMTASWSFNGLALDPGAARLYFSDTTTVNSSGLDGLGIQTLATGLTAPRGVALGPDQERVFFADSAGQKQIGVVDTDGSRQMTLISGLNHPFGLAVIRVESEQQTFAQWRQEKFTVGEFEDSSISGADADPAGDGIANIVKFAFGLEPKIPARGALPTAEIVDDELRLTFPRARNVADVELVVEVSYDLISWQSGPGVTEEFGVDELTEVDLVTVRLLAPLSEAERAFVRVRALLVE